MGRPTTDPERKMLTFTVKMLPYQLKYLGKLREDFDVQFVADVLRELVECFESWFGLPTYQVEVLKKDMASRKQNWKSYLQELLARRYESLILEDKAKSKGK